jgi:PII-like signaling protein
MSLTGTALRMTIFIGESDQIHRRPTYTEIVHRAHARGLAGATVLRGWEGFGASSRIHTSRILSLTEDLPVVILIVDTPEKVRGFLPEVEDLVAEGLIILDEVEVVRYVGRDDDRSGQDSAGTAPGSGPEGVTRSRRSGTRREER